MNYKLIKKPVITEKSLQLVKDENVYTFVVDLHANKDQVREALEKLFGVKVVDIRTVKRPSRIKRTGKRRLAIKTSPVKKAYVKLKVGQKIELFDVYQGQ